MDPDPTLTFDSDPTAITYVFDRTNVGDRAQEFTIGIRTAAAYNVASLNEEESLRLRDALSQYLGESNLVRVESLFTAIGAPFDPWRTVRGQ